MNKNKNLLRSLSTLKEEVIDNTGGKCALVKVWNIILNRYTGDNMPELLERANNRFKMEYYQFCVICDLAKALEIICREEQL